MDANRRGGADFRKGLRNFEFCHRRPEFTNNSAKLTWKMSRFGHLKDNRIPANWGTGFTYFSRELHSSHSCPRTDPFSENRELPWQGIRARANSRLTVQTKTIQEVIPMQRRKMLAAVLTAAGLLVSLGLASPAASKEETVTLTITGMS